MQAIATEIGLGVVFTMIALAPMVPDWIKHDPGATMSVKVMTGLPDDQHNDLTGGSFPQITLFDANGKRLGYWRNKGGKEIIHAGSTMEKQLTYIDEGSSAKPEYITLTASGFDAICVTSVVVTHPASSDTYAFLPGEMAATCANGWEDKDDIKWSNQVSAVQFKSESGKTADARPKCFWLDSVDEHGVSYTKWKGLSVHLPDFKLDNSTFKTWEDDNFQMCGSKARFGLWTRINEMMCPPVFTKAPDYGARIPMEESPGCAPGLFPDANGNVQEDLCKDPAVTGKERKKYSDAFGLKCEDHDDSPGDFHSQCGRSIGRRSPMACSGRKRSEAVAKISNHRLQDRFLGKLIKTRDELQSARESCESPGSVGPNLYSHSERLFCDMQTRKLFPRCEKESDVDCFDEYLNSTRHVKERRDETITHLSVQDWPRAY